MDEAEQQNDLQFEQHTSTSKLNAKANSVKPKTRQVHSRYLQAKPVPAVRSGTGIPPSGRYSLAGCNSTGWVELQLDHHSTPLMVNTGTQSAVFTQTSKARQAQMRPTPAPGTGRRTLRHQEAEQQQRKQLTQQRQQQRKVYAGADSAGRPSFSAPYTPAATGVQQPDTGAVPDVCYQVGDSMDLPTTAIAVQKGTHAGLVSPGSSRSSICSSMQASQALVPDFMPVKTESAQLCTPQVPRLSASMFIGATTAVKLNRLGMSTGGAGLPSQARTASKEAEDRRRMLEEYRQQKKLQQQQSADGNASRGSQGGFKEPQPKNLSQVARAPLSVHRTGSTNLLSVSRADSTSAGGDKRHSAPGSSASPSQFTATMRTLQQTGSGSKPQSGGKSVRPLGVPLLQMDKIHQAAGSTPTHSNSTPVQRQQVNRSPLVPPSSGSRIPQYDLSHQQQEGVTPPLSSRRVSSAAHVPLPDATPRAIRDAAPSKLPKTPRGMPTPRRATDDDDVVVHAARPSVPVLRLGGLAGASVAPDAGQTARYNTNMSRRSPAAAAAAGNPAHTSALGGMGTATTSGKVAPSPPSARRTSVMTSSRQSSRYASSSGSAAQASQQQPEQPRIMRTPRNLLTSKGPAEANAVCKKSEQDKLDETKQQLKLLRNQNLQLRHLACRIEQAVQQKRDKASSVLAAAATVITDMYSQLTDLQKQAQQQKWSSELSRVLKQQLPRLQAWKSLQAQHTGDLTQLQHACSSALSHVPLLNGASIGQHAEQPDLQLLQHQLIHGMQLLQGVQPALQQLLGPDLSTAQNSDTRSAVSEPAAQQPHVSNVPCDIRNSVSTTALLADQLMKVAAEECCLLGHLAQQAETLSDLHLYANSMQVQLSQMQTGMSPE